MPDGTRKRRFSLKQPAVVGTRITVPFVSFAASG